MSKPSKFTLHRGFVTISVELFRRLPNVVIAGMGFARTKDAVERLRMTLEGQGKDLPRGRLVITIEPRTGFTGDSPGISSEIDRQVAQLFLSGALDRHIIEALEEIDFPAPTFPAGA